jgi:hypothetical protein
MVMVRKKVIARYGGEDVDGILYDARLLLCSGVLYKARTEKENKLIFFLS